MCVISCYTTRIAKASHITHRYNKLNFYIVSSYATRIVKACHIIHVYSKNILIEPSFYIDHIRFWIRMPHRFKRKKSALDTMKAKKDNE